MKCPNCKGKARRIEKDLELKRDGTTTRFTNVPVIVCEECGEELIEGEVFTNLTNIANTPARARRRA